MATAFNWPHTLPDELPLYAIPAGKTLSRIHRILTKEHPEPYFGPPPGTQPDHRFHDPLGVFRVCFLGLDATASFVETFLRRPPVRLVTQSELDLRRLSTVQATRPLHLVQLFGSDLARVGCTADVTSSPAPYAAPQALARALWSHPGPPLADGIVYCCRHDNSRYAIALFDRARDAISIADTAPLLRDRDRLLEWSTRYGFDIG